MTRLCAMAWVLGVLGILAFTVCLTLPDGDLLIRISTSLVAGIAAVVIFQIAFYLASRRGVTA